MGKYLAEVIAYGPSAGRSVRHDLETNIFSSGLTYTYMYMKLSQ